jgi:hypothetical protein
MEKFKIEIKWAFFFSMMTLIWMLAEKLFGLHDKYIDYHIYLTNLYAIPAIWILVMALKDKKKSFFNGKMSYSQGLLSGIFLSLIIAAFSPLTQWITTYIITPEYFPNVIKRSVEIGYFKTTAEAKANFNYANYAVQGAIGALIMGLLTSAIAMIFVRSKN